MSVIGTYFVWLVVSEALFYVSVGYFGWVGVGEHYFGRVRWMGWWGGGWGRWVEVSGDGWGFFWVCEGRWENIFGGWGWVGMGALFDNARLKFLCDAKLITPLLIFWFLVKIWSENSISIQINTGITHFWICLFGGAKYKGRDEAEAKGTDEQPFSDKPPLIRCGQTYSAWQ